MDRMGSVGRLESGLHDEFVMLSRQQNEDEISREFSKDANLHENMFTPHQFVMRDANGLEDNKTDYSSTESAERSSPFMTL